MATITYFPAAAAGGGTVATVVAGSGISVNATDPANPIVTNTLFTGVAGGQTIYGGTLTTQNLTLRPNFADSTTGRVIASGAGLQFPNGSVGVPTLTGGSTNTGWYQSSASSWKWVSSGTDVVYIDVSGYGSLSNGDLTGYYIGSAFQAGVLKDGATTGMKFLAGAAVRGGIKSTGSWVVGTAALATSATDGFLYIPTCAGTPSGVPSTQTGTVAMIYDTTNNKFYIYNGAWKGGTAPGVFS